MCFLILRTISSTAHPIKCIYFIILLLPPFQKRISSGFYYFIWFKPFSLSLFSLSAACVSGELEKFLEPSESPWPLQSVAEEETRLPCRFNVSNSAIKVVQVTWIRENSNGGEEQLITAHFSEGQTGKTIFFLRLKMSKLKLLHIFQNVIS